ncbi:MAG TPA: glutamate formimidoyltransferase [Thermoanaerobaculia bacterium]|nr:glutamate formimidoyltransferase [Thermoanaerobaculia bacterium]
MSSPLPPSGSSGAPRLECVPNVSEGRRPEVLERLAAAVAAVPGVALLDASRDPDHHRSVLTLAGDAAPLVAALLALYEVALAEVDLTRHRGAHPRIGAVDVVPFVPLDAVPMSEAVAAARELGRRVAERFALPVHLYEEAATAPHRRRLAEVRRGGFEALAERLADPRWQPDFGPPRAHPTAGATAIGARDFLVAANAILDTDDLALAREVARTVRESSGGLPAVRALGVALPSRGCVQVSMNLVDHRLTSPAAAFAAVEAEARRRGARVVERELIGLVPQAALEGEGKTEAEHHELRRLREEWGGRTLEGRLDAPSATGEGEAGQR